MAAIKVDTAIKGVPSLKKIADTTTASTILNMYKVHGRLNEMY